MLRPTLSCRGGSVIGLARRLAFVLLLSFAGTAAALDYPTHAVRWIVPYPPGGSTDVLARMMSQWFSEKMGQSFVIENKAGGGNNIGVEFVVKSAPDGYTMLLVNPANGINTTLYKNLPFDFIRDIAPVAGLVRAPNVMEVNNSFPARTVAEFIAHCKANPGKLNMASSGSGTSVHLSGELFKSMTGCDMLHVPFKGAAPALVARRDADNADAVLRRDDDDARAVEERGVEVRRADKLPVVESSVEPGCIGDDRADIGRSAREPAERDVVDPGRRVRHALRGGAQGRSDVRRQNEVQRCLHRGDARRGRPREADRRGWCAAR